MVNIPQDDKPPSDGASKQIEGEWARINEDPPDYREAGDGGIYMKLPAKQDNVDGEFYRNLADIDIDEAILQKMATDLLEVIKQDQQDREKRDKLYEEGLRRTGLGNDAPGGATFEGASRVVHPMITKACIDFASRVIKEIFPPGGPVKSRMIGRQTAARVAKGDRKCRYMNWQLTEQIKEAKAVLEETMTQVPMGGSQYIKLRWDHKLKRARYEFVPIDNLILPFSASCFLNAQRATHIQYLSDLEYKERVASGMYREVTLGAAPSDPDRSKASVANDKIEGKEPGGTNMDGVRRFYEVALLLEVLPDLGPCLDEEKEGAIYPYLITIEETSGEIVSWYRNWEEGDETCAALDNIVEFPFIPWRGSVAIGFPHIIGGLSGAATGALRALLDSAHLNTQATLARLKNTGVPGQTVKSQPGGASVEVEASVAVSDIRQAAMQLTFNPPSEVLMRLLEFLTTQGELVVRTSMDNMGAADGSPAQPVGSQMQDFSNGMAVYNSIFGRMHHGMKQLLRIQHRLNRFYMPKRHVVDEHEVLGQRSDFEGPLDIIPVSDPHVTSDQQRFMQSTAMVSRATGNPLYNARKVEERWLRDMKVEDPDEFLVPAPQPKELNAISENVAMAMGQPVVVFPTQNHLAHMQIHMDFMMSKVFGMNPALSKTVLPAMVDHLKQHIAQWYLVEAYQIITDEAGVDAGNLMSENPMVRYQMDELMASISSDLVKQAEETFAQVPQIITQVTQLIQKLLPPPPVDPSVAIQNVEKMKQDGHAQDRDIKTTTDKEKLAAQVRRDEQASQDRREGVAAKVFMSEQDNKTAEELALLDAETGKDSALSTGSSVGAGGGHAHGT